MISIIMSIFNQEALLDKIVNGLFENSSSLVKEYIFILDGCVDNSSLVLENVLKKIPLDTSYKIFTAPNVYEIRSNNIGLKAATQPYVCIVQDDMLICEKNWDQRMVKPFFYFDDIFAITSRTTCSLNSNGKWIDCIEGPIGHNYGKSTNISRDKLYIGQVVNRGPLMFDHDKLKELGYLDETLPFVTNADDCDLCMKAFIRHKWRCGTYWIYYNSPLSWGASRKSPNKNYLFKHFEDNVKELLKRYPELIKTWNSNEVRELPDSFPLYPIKH